MTDREKNRERAKELTEELTTLYKQAKEKEKAAKDKSPKQTIIREKTDKGEESVLTLRKPTPKNKEDSQSPTTISQPIPETPYIPRTREEMQTPNIEVTTFTTTINAPREEKGRESGSDKPRIAITPATPIPPESFNLTPERYKQYIAQQEREKEKEKEREAEGERRANELREKEEGRQGSSEENPIEFPESETRSITLRKGETAQQAIERLQPGDRKVRITREDGCIKYHALTKEDEEKWINKKKQRKKQRREDVRIFDNEPQPLEEEIPWGERPSTHQVSPKPQHRRPRLEDGR